MRKINVKELINSPFAVSIEDGELIYNEILSLMESNTSFALDLFEIEEITPAFLNAALSKFYKNDEEKIERLMLIQLYYPQDAELIKIATENIKKYWKDPEKWDKAWEDELND